LAVCGENGGVPSIIKTCLPRTTSIAVVMKTVILLFIFLLSFVVLVFAFFALSSCLGDELRAAWSGRPRNGMPPTTYGLQYARIMSHGGNQAGCDQIEMEDMLDNRLGRGVED
jgi:hypothetical protein